jgi:drug/metabolite transporter (DMT)-like permease
VQAWQIAALAASCCIAAHYLLLRAASGRVGDSLGALILEATAAIGIAVMYAVGLRGGDVPTTRAGVVFAMLSGVGITFAGILLFYALRRGGPVASTGMIVMGGGVALSALVSPFLFREPLTARRVIGVALGLLAIAILATERPPSPESP